MLVLALLGGLVLPPEGGRARRSLASTLLRLGQALPAVAFSLLLASCRPDPPDLSRLSLEELFARQPDTPWHSSEEPEVQELKRRVEAGTLNADAWRTLLTDHVIHARTRWPVGEPLLLWIQEPAWLPLAKIAVRAVEPELGEVAADNRTPSGCANCWIWNLDQQRRLRMAPLPAGTRRVRVEASIEQAEASFASTPGSHLVWRGELTLPIEAVDSLEQAMPSFSVPEVGADLRDSLRVIRREGSDGVRSLEVSLEVSYDRFPALRGLAVSVNLQVRNRGEVREEVRITKEGGLDGWYGYGKFEHLPAEMADEGFDTTDWELTVTGVPDGVLSIWEADRWWNGSVSMPLAEALRAPEDR